MKTKIFGALAAIALITFAGFFNDAKALQEAPKPCKGGCCYYTVHSSGSTSATCSLSSNGDECSTVSCCNAV